MLGKWRFYLLYILLAGAGLYMHLHSDIAVPSARSFQEFPALHNGWRMTGNAEFSQEILDVLRPADYLVRQYVDQDGRRVDLYVGYHSGGKDSGAIHSPRNCMPGGGWHQTSSTAKRLDTGEAEIALVRAVYRHGERSELFLYWFQVGSRTLSNEYALKLAEISNSMVNRRRESTFVRVSVPFEADEEKAYEAGKRFIQDFYPVLKTFIPYAT